MSNPGENLQPHVLMAIARQIRQLVTAPLQGVRYVPSEQITEILAEVDGPQGTPFEGGTFLVKLVLGSDYPAAPPKGYMLTKIFHPNVSLTGEICVNTLKKDWKPEHTLQHVLQVIHCLLIVPFPESSLNDEAGKLFMESYEEYARKAKLMTGIHASAAAAAAPASEAGSAGGAAAASSASSATASSSSSSSSSSAEAAASSAEGDAGSASGSAAATAAAAAAAAAAGLTAGKSNAGLGAAAASGLGEKKEEKRKAEKDEKGGKASKSLKRL